MKYAVLLLIVFLAGCTLFGGGEKEVDKAILTAELPTPSVHSGDNTVLYVDGLNDGNTELNVGFVIEPRNPQFVKITYPGELQYVIRPQETTGRKVITVTASTEAERSDYAINVFLRNMKTGEDLDDTTVFLSVSQ